jgi:hypothetical protein
MGYKIYKGGDGKNCECSADGGEDLGNGWGNPDDNLIGPNRRVVNPELPEGWRRNRKTGKVYDEAGKYVRGGGTCLVVGAVITLVSVASAYAAYHYLS